MAPVAAILLQKRPDFLLFNGYVVFHVVHIYPYAIVASWWTSELNPDLRYCALGCSGADNSYAELILLGSILES